MPSYLDLALLGIILVSAILSMVRGFTREVLAIASWAAAAVAAYFFHPLVMPYLEPYIAKDNIRTYAAIAAVFFVTLILVSIITVKLSDAILDSKVGALDRTLGFLFGAARGLLLGVVAFLFFNWLVPKAQPEWVMNARMRPLLQSIGDTLIAQLPPDAAAEVMKRLKTMNGTDEAPADETDTKPATAPLPPTRAPDKPTEPTNADRQKLDSIIGKPGTKP